MTSIIEGDALAACSGNAGQVRPANAITDASRGGSECLAGYRLNRSSPGRVSRICLD